MTLKSIKVENLRNIEKADLQFEEVNIIIGKNASGKTSLLEAIHLLLLSKSFRNNQTQVLMKKGTEFFIVTALLSQQGDQPLGIQRKARKTTIKYAGKTVKTAAALAKIQPMLLITPQISQLISGGPQKRRRLIDWILFHVEQDYYTHWFEFTSLLKQRNALLKQKKTGKELDVWENKLITSAELITKKRRETVKKYSKHVDEILSGCSEPKISINYKKGWEEGGYKNVLLDERRKDLLYGYTRKGPHRGDLEIKSENDLAENVLSSGQKKIISSALEIAKIKMLFKKTKKKSVILVDDLPAEMDEERKETFAKMLIDQQAQLFVTTTDLDQIPERLKEKAKLFHVEHGSYKEMI